MPLLSLFKLVVSLVLFYVVIHVALMLLREAIVGVLSLIVALILGALALPVLIVVGVFELAKALWRRRRLPAPMETPVLEVECVEVKPEPIFEEPKKIPLPALMVLPGGGPRRRSRRSTNGRKRRDPRKDAARQGQSTEEGVGREE